MGMGCHGDGKSGVAMATPASALWKSRIKVIGATRGGFSLVCRLWLPWQRRTWKLRPFLCGHGPCSPSSPISNWILHPSGIPLFRRIPKNLLHSNFQTTHFCQDNQINISRKSSKFQKYSVPSNFLLPQEFETKKKQKKISHLITTTTTTMAIELIFAIYLTDGGRRQLRQRRHSLFHPVQFGNSANATGLLPHVPKRHDHLRSLPAHRWHFLPLTQAVLQILHSRKLFPYQWIH